MRHKNDDATSTTATEEERANAVPEIEPPCPDCVRVREETSRPEALCAVHSTPREQAHVYRYRRELPFREHASSVVPTGIDPRRVR